METASATPDSCFVCRKHTRQVSIPGGVIYEDDLVYAGHAQIRDGQGTTYLGYLMAEPKRHLPGLAELRDEEAEALAVLVTCLARALKATEGAEHVYAFVLGDQVPHLHVHVVPRYPGTPRTYWGVHVDEWPEAPRGGAPEMEAVCARLRAFLEKSQPHRGCHRPHSAPPGWRSWEICATIGNRLQRNPGRRRGKSRPQAAPGSFKVRL